MSDNKCKWEHDEVCVNASCPKCSDFCPVLDEPGVCRYEDRGKKTNADKIRSMTDEELADLFLDTYDDEEIFYCPVEYYRGCRECDCRKCFLDWLKQEVSDNG